MATTQEMKYEDQRDENRSAIWRWLVPIAIALLALWALSSYLDNRAEQNNLNSGTNTELPYSSSELQTQ
jgi:hypothetical protein